MTGRILGMDLGEKRVGLALSDPLHVSAQPLGIIKLEKEELLDKLRQLVAAHGITRVVVGLPKNMDGSLGTKATEALALAQRLRDELKLPVVTWDERLSTVRAERALRQAGLSHGKRKKRIDTVAAQLILQSFLDAHRRGDRDR